MKVEVGPNIIILEEETNLPEGWKEGDLFKVIIGANGQVTLMKVTQIGAL